jgi:hypothetical protein
LKRATYYKTENDGESIKSVHVTEIHPKEQILEGLDNLSWIFGKFYQDPTKENSYESKKCVAVEDVKQLIDSIL